MTELGEGSNENKPEMDFLIETLRKNQQLIQVNQQN